MMYAGSKTNLVKELGCTKVLSKFSSILCSYTCDTIDLRHPLKWLNNQPISLTTIELKGLASKETVALHSNLVDR